MPWLTLLAAPLLADSNVTSDLAGRAAGADAAARSERSTLIRWGVALACQFAITAVIVTRIVGFHVPSAAP